MESSTNIQKHRTGEPEWVKRLCAQEVQLQRFLKLKMSWIEPFAMLIHFLAREVGLTLIVCLSLSTGAWKFANQSMFIMCYCELYNALIKFVVMEPRPIWREDIIVSTTPEKDNSNDKQQEAKGKGQSLFSRLLRPKAWEPDYSFPSSHSMVMLGLSLSFGKYFGYDSATFAIVFSLAILGGLTRAYLGQHYFHDVLCGWLIELFLAIPMINAFDTIADFPWYVHIAIAVALIPYYKIFDFVM